MGIKRAKERARRVPVGEIRPVLVTIEEQPETLHFSVPGLVQVKEAIRLGEQVQAEYLLPVEMAVTVALLAITYIPAEEDGTIQPVAEFAELATSMPGAFIEVTGQHGKVFADCFDWITVREQVKNASGETVAAQ